MRTVQASLVPSLLLIVCLCATVSAQQAGRIESMKLLTPDVGWAATARNLFWTVDSGQHWKDIAPKFGPGQSIDSVFFQDASTGWVLLIGEDAGADEPRFDLASTANAGTNWSISRVKIPHLNPESTTLTGGSHIDFVDSLHGWMNLPVVSGAAFRLGILLATADGGKSWDWVPESPGVSGIIRFISPNDGWLAGGPGDEHLYVTHDGSKSWQESSLKAPPETGKAIHPLYDSPIFADSKNGFLPVTYSGPEGAGLSLVLFSTHDGGNTWKLDRVLPRLPEIYGGMPFPSAVADSVLLTVYGTGRVRPRLTAVPPDGKADTKSAQIPYGSSVLQLSFVGRGRGWALADSRLLSTTDTGDTWTDVTPPAVGRATSNGGPPFG
jgi:photosystem II stability/assembly factor-like uncharacterized protein